MADEPKGQKVHVKLDETLAQGVYVNLAMVRHTEMEFTIDGLYLQPQQPVATLRTRMISSPKHTKRLMLALQENLRRYEERYGVLDVSGPNPADELLH